MREYQFTVSFGGVTAATTRHEFVLATSEAAARILAQAKQINKGNRFDDVCSVENHGSRYRAADGAAKAAHHSMTGD